MIVTINWLRDFVDTPLSVEELVDRLTMVGLEVEGVHERGAGVPGVVTARVERVRPHPNADRLRLCDVTDGRRMYQVVCGAPNVEEGHIVALALPGTRLPSGLTIQETTIRGEFSQGMLCSQRELEMGEDADGIWLLDGDTPLGISLSEALGAGDTVIDVSVTPNRADCMSVVGIAREVGAICGSPLRYPALSLREDGPPVDMLTSVTIDDPVGCPRYAARVIQGIRIGPSPRWLRERLESIGLRSINNIVDVTNYVMMEMGQPLHAFDFDRLAENRIVVRRAAENEKFTTLDGVERSLFSDTLMICDGRGPVAVAGIMGGLDSEITGETRRVLIESAYFQPQSIRRTSKKLGLRSESSYRFERGVDPEGVIRALDRAAQLIMEVGGGELASGRVDVYPSPITTPSLTLRVERVNNFLGTSIDNTEMAAVLRSIEMQVTNADASHLEVVPPAFRQDVTREVDLAEEVARLAGYDRIPVTYPEISCFSAPHDPHLRMREEVKTAMQGMGFFEVINYSFVSAQSLSRLRFVPDDPRVHPVEVMNPISDEQAVMRTTLIAGLVQTTRHNLDRRNNDLRIFELSKIFLPVAGAPLPEERYHLAGVMSGRRYPHLLYGGDDVVDYADVKGVVEDILDLFHLERDARFRTDSLPPYLDPLRSASVFIGERQAGALGRMHVEVEEAFDLKQPVHIFELDFDVLYELRHPQQLFVPLPKFPSVARDMALIVDEDLPVQDLVDFILRQDEPLLEHVEIFDLYRGPQFGKGKKSAGYRLVYRAADRNLTDEETNTVHGRLVQKVVETFNARLR